MRHVEGELDRYLTLLRNKIRERGFTQMEVQEALSWGRSYISQLLTKQKNLRVDQVLMILNVIGVEPAAFFAEIYDLPGPDAGWPEKAARSSIGPGAPLAQDLEKFKRLLNGLVGLLVDKKIVAPSDLRAAVERVEARGD